jgi:hypothetical protein
MTATKTILQGAALVDYTSTVSGFKQMNGFGQAFVDLVRSGERPTSIVVIDRAGSALPLAGPAIVRDHLNLTGTSPLLGPNHECGERFPVLQGIYIVDQFQELPKVLLGGLKPGVEVSADDARVLREFGVEAYSYNIAQSMLIAAHARCRMLAVLLPDGQALPDKLSQEILALTGAKK